MLRGSLLYNYGEALHEFYQHIRSTLSQIAIVRIDENAWSQAPPPGRFGGLVLWRAVDILFPAFISSVHDTNCLLDALTFRVSG